MSQFDGIKTAHTSAVLDSMHVGEIRGAFGTIASHDMHARRTFGQRIKTLLAILGPGLIVMVGDNDAGAFSTYAQAGQDFGTTLLWTLLLLVPVLYVNQEMVLRLGAVTGVGHARLIFERFGKFWGTFSIIDLFLLNALTIVTEFVGISLGLDYLGVSKFWGILIAAVVIMIASGTGDFRKFERFALFLVFGSLLLVPIFLIIHPPMGEMARGFFIPALPGGRKLSDVMLLIIAIVGTTVAPWQLFFQQSYVIDKRISPRFMKYERIDLWLGIVLVVIGAVAIMGFTAATFNGHTESGHFSDTSAVAAGMEKYVGRTPGVLFALALIDACIVGAAAVSLSTAYALGDVFSIRHSLHRKPTEALGFYAALFFLIALAAILVLVPGIPLGLLTNLVQALAGVLLPSATVFLLLLCNDREILGPWVNSRNVNIFTAAIIGILVMLSVILVASVLFPDIEDSQILAILAIGTGIGGLIFSKKFSKNGAVVTASSAQNETNSVSPAHWRMPPLSQLKPLQLTPMIRIGLGVLRGYLALAAGLLLFKLLQLASF